MPPKQQVTWLDVTMNQVFLMRVMQCPCDILDIGEHRFGGKLLPWSMAIFQSAIGGVIHHQKRDALLNAALQNAHDVSVDKARHHLCLAEESIAVFFGGKYWKNLNGGFGL